MALDIKAMVRASAELDAEEARKARRLAATPAPAAADPAGDLEPSWPVLMASPAAEARR